LYKHGTYFQFAWKDKKEWGLLYKHFRRKGRKYCKRVNAKGNREIIKNRVDIVQRPAVVNEKQRLGDLEIDTVIGQNHKGAFLTINDWASNKSWIAKLEGKNADELAQKTIEVLSPYKTYSTRLS